MVGSALYRTLRKGGYDNIIIRDIGELDLREQKAVDAFFKSESPEYVFLAAAKVGGILANSTYKAEFVYDNLIIAANVIHAAYKYKAKKLLNLGSSCIYPKDIPQPMKEEDLLTGKLEPTNEPYAIAKISAIKMCRYYNEQYDTDYISVMPTNQYGINDNYNLETGHVLPSMLRKIHLAKLLNNGDYSGLREDIQKRKLGFGIGQNINLSSDQQIEEALQKVGIKKQALVLWGSGEPLREFMFSDDLADACVFLMENKSFKEIGELVNIGTGDEVKVKRLAEIISEIVGYKGLLVWDTLKPDGARRKLLDISKLRKLGWDPKTSLIKGIKNTYADYVKSGL